MAKIDEKIAAQAFTVMTDKDFAEVRRLGSEAAERSAGVITKVVERGTVKGRSVGYDVKRVGAFTVLDFDVVFTESEDGGNRVSLRVGDYVSSQATVLGFIPLGPKDAAGFGPLRTFSTTFRQMLS